MTPASAFGRAPTVCGISVWRSSLSDSFDASFVPLPSIGIVMFATVRSLLTSIVIGSWTRPLANARCSSCAIAPRMAGELTFVALTITFAGNAVPGNACCMRLYVLTTSR